MSVLIVILCLIGLVLLAALICFLLAFYAPGHKPAGPDEYPLPKGRAYEPYRQQMVGWMQTARRLPHREVSITSFDGLTLCGRYYEQSPGAPMELMFHGYRGSGERDLCGGIQRAFSLGRNVLIVEQRTSGGSGGHVITFGVREQQDCRDWVNFAINAFPGVPIILTGISMGASTVLLAAGRPLPPQVKGVLADCGYTSAREILCKVIRQLHLPARLLYPLLRLGARLYGGFDPEQADVRKAMETCSVPVIFIHGEADDFVPCSMSRENHAACTAPKALLTVPGAGHGLAYLADPDGYLQALCKFFTANGVPTERTEKAKKP